MKLVLEMEVRGSDEDADHVHAAVNSSINILLDRSGESRDLGLKPQVADLFHRVHLCGRDHRKARLNDLHADLVQPESDIQLLIGPKDHSRHLLPIAQSYIADLYVQRRSPGQTEKLIQGIVLHNAVK